MATLTTTITEEITLNGKDRGSSNTMNITSVSDIYHRLVSCPANNDTTVATFQAAVHTSDNANPLACKYIRVTNLDQTNQVVMSLQISNDEDGTADASTSILLTAGQSFMMSSGEEGIATSDANANIITDGDMHDLESIIIDPKGNTLQVDVFIAS